VLLKIISLPLQVLLCVVLCLREDAPRH
jgi:hypothetical protein